MPASPDLWVLVQNGKEYFFFYARGSEQVKRVQALCKELNIDMAIFNFVVEIYKPLIKEYHTSTLMALA